ncbi:ABC transporter ATP-binding protein [Brevundimonas sp. S1H14]|uniref:ABC transporter ATP-binding protein n=1 Tax=Brevundimonas sp. S1H14 TaxID=3078084 RepID=UPI0039EAD637
MTVLLELENAHARIGGAEVLNGACFSVRAGELVALCGPNGAGKSTALRAALGLAPLTQGVARLGGDEARRLSERQRGERAAYLPQDRSIAWNLPAVEVAALGAPFLKGQAAVERARAALDEVGVGHLADRGVAEMSGGERARVLLARALTVPAPLLAADEPIAGLDPDAQLLVLELLRARAAAGRGVLVSLHDLSLAARFADRVVVLDQGRTAAEGAPTVALSPGILKTVFNLDAVWLEALDGPWLAARRLSPHG